jgi:hypothetical protein
VWGGDFREDAGGMGRAGLTAAFTPSPGGPSVSLFNERPLSCYLSPRGREPIVCPSEEYVSSNLLTRLKNIVSVPGHDDRHVAIDPNRPVYGLDLSVLNVP